MFFYYSSYHYLSLYNTPIDIDECALGLAGCDVNANCSDTEGSYECTCSLGYTGSGLECSGRWLFSTSVSLHVCCNTDTLSFTPNSFPDIDECLSNSCNVNGICANVPGSFICTCNPGYSGDGFMCAGMPCFPVHLPFQTLSQLMYHPPPPPNC